MSTLEMRGCVRRGNGGEGRGEGGVRRGEGGKNDLSYLFCRVACLSRVQVKSEEEAKIKTG